MDSLELEALLENRKHEKHRIVLHVYDDESKEFTSLTTYHGMIRIYSSDTWPSRIFWCLVVVTCLVLFLLHSGMMLEFYHSKPTFRQYTDEPLQLEDLPFITICKENGYTAMKNISLKEEEFDVAFRVMRQEFLTVDEYEILRRLENERRVTAEELYTSLSLTCKELLKTLKVSGKGYDACEFASEDLTEYGVCWTVGKWPARRANDRVEIVIKNTKPASNIIVHVHSRLVQPSVMAKGLYIPKDRIAHMIVQPNMVDSLEIGSWGTCSKEWSSKIHLGENYTLTNCFRHCMAQQFLEACACVPYHLKAFGEPICTLGEMHTCRRAANEVYNHILYNFYIYSIFGLPSVRCSCKPQCNRPRYSVQRPTYLQVAPNKRNSSILLIDFSSSKLIRIQQLKRFKAIDLLSYVAGSMGLFLGMSCVTLLEIFMFLFKVAWGTVNDNRHKEFFDRMLEGTEKKREPQLKQQIIIASRKNSAASDSSESDSSECTIVEENIGIVFDEKRKASIFRMPDSVIQPRNKFLERVRSSTNTSIKSGGKARGAFGIPDPTNLNTRRRLSHFPGIGF